MGTNLLARSEEPHVPNVFIGKDLIELLTSAMYVSPVTVFREYVQNSADSIDLARAAGLLGRNEGCVRVTLDHKTRSVSVSDDGAGLPAGEASSTLLSIGASSKRGTSARGFRGVGRLSGLAYCRKLEFRTKAAGEDVITSVAWDCDLLRARLGDKTFNGDLEALIRGVVAVSASDAAPDSPDHFFEVRLVQVARHRYDALMNERLISRYLGQVAPVAFSPDFRFAGAIDEHLGRHMNRAPVSLHVGDEQILRPHRDEVFQSGNPTPFRINDIEYREFCNVDGDVAAVAWIGHHDYVRSIPVGFDVRGLRARAGDIQVGEADLFDQLFKEPRFNGWSVGEIHVLDRRISPNARRDNFELNHHAYDLHARLAPLALELSQRCRSSSISRTAEQIVKNFATDAAERLARGSELSRADVSGMRAAVVRSRAKLKVVQDDGVRQQLEQMLATAEAQMPTTDVREDAGMVPLAEAISAVGRTITNREQAKALIELLRAVSA